MLHRRTASLLALLLIPLLASCEDRDRRGIRDPILDEPTPVPPVVQPTRIEYRVLGTIANVTITYFSSAQGTAQVITDVPWFLAYETRADSTFVYLAAEAPADNLLDGTLVVQVFVDGQLFRESRASGFTPSVAVSGEVVR